MIIVVVLGALCLLLVVAVCVSAGNVPDDARQSDAAIRDQEKFEREEIMAGRNGR